MQKPGGDGMNKYMGHQLLKFNAESENHYRDCWGSLLNYLNQDSIMVNGERVSQDEIFKL